MSSLPQTRHRAREIALQIMYEMDSRPDLSAEDAVATYPYDGEDDDAVQYAGQLVRAVFARSDVIDEMMRDHIIGWRTERMVTVDRAAIRLAICEGLIERFVPVPVAISEAVEIAKAYGTEDSGRFVNGVLGKIARTLDTGSSEDL